MYAIPHNQQGWQTKSVLYSWPLKPAESAHRDFRTSSSAVGVGAYFVGDAHVDSSVPAGVRPNHKLEYCNSYVKASTPPRRPDEASQYCRKAHVQPYYYDAPVGWEDLIGEASDDMVRSSGGGSRTWLNSREAMDSEAVCEEPLPSPDLGKRVGWRDFAALENTMMPETRMVGRSDKGVQVQMTCDKGVQTGAGGLPKVRSQPRLQRKSVAEAWGDEDSEPYDAARGLGDCRAFSAPSLIYPGVLSSPGGSAHRPRRHLVQNGTYSRSSDEYGKGIQEKPKARAAGKPALEYFNMPLIRKPQ